jgi:rhodanese-related sulfurtransferase
MKKVRTTIQEAAIVVLLAFVVGLSANSINGKGVKLSRDYFKKTITAPPSVSPSNNHQPDPTSMPATGNSDHTEDADGVHRNSSGLQAIGMKLAVEWYDDPKTAGMQYIWVDARKLEQYAEGHIPFAHLMYHYQVDDYLPLLMPMLQVAEKIIVYCGGGDCEDSILLARYLVEDAGLPFDKVYVFEKGMEGWLAGGHPIQKGNQP